MKRKLFAILAFAIGFSLGLISMNAFAGVTSKEVQQDNKIPSGAVLAIGQRGILKIDAATNAKLSKDLGSKREELYFDFVMQKNAGEISKKYNAEKYKYLNALIQSYLAVKTAPALTKN